MEKLSKEAESLIIESVSRVNELVNSGLNPTDAAIKVAEENSLQPDYIQLVAQAYNIGATNEHRQNEKTVLGKAASFPIIDPKKVVKARYPDELKSAAQLLRQEAVADDYSHPPHWVRERNRLKVACIDQNWALTEKKASYQTDPELEVKKEIAHQDRLQKKAENARTEMSRYYNQVMGITNSLRLYFKQASKHIPFKTVEANCKMKYGDKVNSLFDRLLDSNPEFTKSASKSSILGPMIGRPYDLVRDWLDSVDKFAESKNNFSKLAGEYNDSRVIKPELAKRARPMHVLDGVISLSEKSSSEVSKGHPSVTGNVLNPTIVKEAASAKKIEDGKILSKKAENNPKPWFGNSATFLRSIKPLFSSTPQSLSSVQKADMDHAKRLAYDPKGMANIDNLRTQAMLHDMLLNDDVISGYDPSEVALAYNDLRGLVPEIAVNPVTARAFLRKHLAQGQTDPYDLDLAAGLENKVRKRNEQHLTVEGARMGIASKPKIRSEKEEE